MGHDHLHICLYRLGWSQRLHIHRWLLVISSLPIAKAKSFLTPQEFLTSTHSSSCHLIREEGNLSPLMEKPLVHIDFSKRVRLALFNNYCLINHTSDAKVPQLPEFRHCSTVMRSPRATSTPRSR